MQRIEQISPYFMLMRLNKPIGILLLLWPTLWGLWLASGGKPDLKILFIFVSGVILMRSAGCIMNDFADRNFDGAVERTRFRPFPEGKVSTKAALGLAAVLCLCAFSLVLMCNSLTVRLSFIGLAFAIIYPFLKRITHLPQLGLGIALAWGIPMAFAAETGTVPVSSWFLFASASLWSIIYDTFYAMADRADDLVIGVKSTAILFKHHDRWVIGILQLLLILMLGVTGLVFHLKQIYFFSLLGAAVFFLYQQWLIKDRHPKQCLSAFENNQWVGFVVFLGISLSFFPGSNL